MKIDVYLSLNLMKITLKIQYQNQAPDITFKGSVHLQSMLHSMSGPGLWGHVGQHAILFPGIALTVNGDRAFLNTAPCLWNSLPQCLIRQQRWHFSHPKLSLKHVFSDNWHLIPSENTLIDSWRIYFLPPWLTWTSFEESSEKLTGTSCHLFLKLILKKIVNCVQLRTYSVDTCF